MIYYFIVLILHLLLSLCYYLRLPYYNQDFNVAVILSSLIIAYSAAVFLIGENQNNASIVFVMILFGIPFLSIFCVYFIPQRLEKLQSVKLDYIGTIWEIEIRMRKEFIDGNVDSNSILKNSYRGEGITPNKILYIIESYYLFIKKDSKIAARAHLSYAKMLPKSIEYDYQLFRCEKYLTKDHHNDCLKYL